MPSIAVWSNSDNEGIAHPSEQTDGEVCQISPVRSIDGSWTWRCYTERSSSDIFGGVAHAQSAVWPVPCPQSIQTGE